MNATTGLSTPLCLYLVRHGETAWSLSGQHTGRTDLPLTANGARESRDLAERLRGVHFSHVLSSPSRRAHQTCKLAGLGQQEQIDVDLAEWDYGDYEGRRTAEIHEMRRDWNIFQDGCPHGEMPKQVSDRADRLIARLRKLDGNIALFTHGQFGAAVGVRWIGLPLVEAEHFTLASGSLSILGADPRRPGMPVLALWNAKSIHAAGPASLQGIEDAAGMRTRALERWENEGGELLNQRRSSDVGER